ncbi:unnamed protein product [Kluyveromyces dobzhanskii CBS 2104]|uniref:WGS project CCBQ000000000 data, contig 00104 n=1 Tax=Kluyveromyces dobzhanskii CBS 2104 TaxID=1427455 RepID=A0A0A8L3U4_9SACH|nr:unnamed protein product [Kluyveromyces dobzhanskii CBS 2104]
MLSPLSSENILITLSLALFAKASIVVKRADHSSSSVSPTSSSISASSDTVTSNSTELEASAALHLGTFETFGWANPTFPSYHNSCNVTNQRMINGALIDAVQVSSYARDRLLANGTSDEIYQRWFGDGPIFTVAGVIENTIQGVKDDLLFRCDDPQGGCAANPTTWSGYHVLNTTGETNFCDLFYSAKKPLTHICFEGTIIDVEPTLYAGIDLFHRYFHLDQMSSEGYIGEFTEELPDILDLAQNNGTFAVRNVDNYLYYLADVYAEAVVPGGCLGDISAD